MACAAEKNRPLVSSLKTQDFSMAKLLQLAPPHWLDVTTHAHACLRLAGVVILIVSSRLQVRKVPKSPGNLK